MASLCVNDADGGFQVQVMPMIMLRYKLVHAIFNTHCKMIDKIFFNGFQSIFGIILSDTFISRSCG